MAASFSTLGANTATSDGTAIAAGSNTKGSYVQFTASSAIACKTLYAYFRCDGSSLSSYAIDIATGGAGAETDVVPNLFYDQTKGVDAEWLQFIVPVNISAGTRIAVRAEGSSVAGIEQITGILVLCDTSLAALLPTSPSSVTYGVTLGGNDKGTTLDPGGTAHTKGGYVQLTAGAAANLQWLNIRTGHLRNNAMTNATGLCDVAIGAAASESVVIANLPFGCEATRDTWGPYEWGPFPADVFQSQRISLNPQSTIIDATDRLISVAGHGITGTAPSAGASGGVGVVGPGFVVT